MRPVLFEIGPVPIYGFGLMMGLAFIVAHLLLTREFVRRGLSAKSAGTVTLIAIFAGVGGARLLGLLVNWRRVLADPVGEVVYGTDRVFYGGLVLVVVCVWIYGRRCGIPPLVICDAASPGLALAYGMGRIGCLLAGDGDYGLPTDAPWAMTFPHGTVPTLARFNPELVRWYQEIFPDRPVPFDIPVHPTPIYETVVMAAAFAVLWALRKRLAAAGQIFGLFLVLASVERFLVEFLRLNPRYGGLSQAQWVSVVLLLVGAWLVARQRGTT